MSSESEISNAISETKETNHVAENEEVHIVKINETEHMIDSGDEDDCDEVVNNTEQKIFVYKSDIPHVISETKERIPTLENEGLDIGNEKEMEIEKLKYLDDGGMNRPDSDDENFVEKAENNAEQSNKSEIPNAILETIEINLETEIKE